MGLTLCGESVHRLAIESPGLGNLTPQVESSCVELDSKVTYHDLEQRGWIALSEIDKNDDRCVVYMPFFWLIRKLKSSRVFISSHSILASPYGEMFWQDAEGFAAAFQTLRGNLLLSMKPTGEDIPLASTLGDGYFGGAWGPQDVKRPSDSTAEEGSCGCKQTIPKFLSHT